MSWADDIFNKVTGRQTYGQRGRSTDAYKQSEKDKRRRQAALAILLKEQKNEKVQEAKDKRRSISEEKKLLMQAQASMKKNKIKEIEKAIKTSENKSKGRVATKNRKQGYGSPAPNTIPVSTDYSTDVDEIIKEQANKRNTKKALNDYIKEQHFENMESQSENGIQDYEYEQFKDTGNTDTRNFAEFFSDVGVDKSGTGVVGGEVDDEVIVEQIVNSVAGNGNGNGTYSGDVAIDDPQNSFEEFTNKYLQRLNSEIARQEHQTLQQLGMQALQNKNDIKKRREQRIKAGIDPSSLAMEEMTNLMAGNRGAQQLVQDLQTTKFGMINDFYGNTQNLLGVNYTADVAGDAQIQAAIQNGLGMYNNDKAYANDLGMGFDDYLARMREWNTTNTPTGDQSNSNMDAGFSLKWPK